MSQRTSTWMWRREFHMRTFYCSHDQRIPSCMRILWTSLSNLHEQMTLFRLKVLFFSQASKKGAGFAPCLTGCKRVKPDADQLLWIADEKTRMRAGGEAYLSWKRMPSLSHDTPPHLPPSYLDSPFLSHPHPPSPLSPFPTLCPPSGVDPSVYLHHPAPVSPSNRAWII